jgi:hypothetical protein
MCLYLLEISMAAAISQTISDPKAAIACVNDKVRGNLGLASSQPKPLGHCPGKSFGKLISPYT